MALQESERSWRQVICERVKRICCSCSKLIGQSIQLLSGTSPFKAATTFFGGRLLRGRIVYCVETTEVWEFLYTTPFLHPAKRLGLGFTLATCRSEFGLQWPVPMISAGLSKPHLKMYRTLVAISTRFNSENSLVLNDNYSLWKNPENRVQFCRFVQDLKKPNWNWISECWFWILKLGVL